MNIKKEKGSIAIFVLVALLFMVGFLILAFASNANQSKAIQEQSEVIHQIYAYSGEEQGAYNKAYTDLRRKNKQLMTASVENNNTLELNKTYAEKVSNYRIYGNSVQNGTPTPDNPVEIESVGEMINLFDIHSVKKFIRDTGNNNYTEANDSSYSSISDNVITNNTGLYGWRILCVSNISKLPAGTYTLSVEAMADNSDIKDVYIGVNKNKKHIVLSSYKTWERISYTFTLDQETEIIGFEFQGGGTKDKYYNLNIKFKNIQLEKGSTATEYKPYGICKIPIKLTNEKGESTTTNILLDEPLRKVKDEADYIDFKTKKVVRVVKEKVFTGENENWGRWEASTTSSTCGVYYMSSDELGVYQSPKFSNKLGYSNYFRVLLNTLHDKNDSQLGQAYPCPSAQPPYIAFKVPYTSLTVFKTEFLAKKYQEGNPLRITYNILTPEETNLELPELATFEDYTKIEVLTELKPSKVEIEYIGYTLD